MLALFLLGGLLGLRHALDADHLAAVAALSRGGSLGQAVRRGATWGFGHTATLLVAGAVCLLGRWTIPARVADGLELGVGLMLLGLGAGVLRRVRRERISWRPHRHGAGAVHLHAHPSGEPAHRHDHALFVGMAHGLAGSAAVLLLALPAAVSPWHGLGYIVCFGLGSIVGMAALSAVISLPLSLVAGTAPFSRAHACLQVAIGCTTLGLGGWIVWRGLQVL